MLIAQPENRHQQAYRQAIFRNTEEEIEAVIEWKAQVKARNEQFQQTLQAIKDAQAEQLKVMQDTASKDAARQDAFLQASIERLNRANGGA